MMGVNGFTESYTESYYREHPELWPEMCPVCGSEPIVPQTCCICTRKACRTCGAKGVDFIFACSIHPRITTEHEITIEAEGRRVTRTLRHTWLRGNGGPLIEKTEMVSVAGKYHESAAWFWDIEDSAMDKAINKFLLEEGKKGGDSEETL